MTGSLNIFLQIKCINIIYVYTYQYDFLYYLHTHLLTEIMRRNKNIKMIYIFFQYEMLKSAAFGYTLDGPSVLYAIRMALINGIIDPWLYIFVRRETLLMVSTLFRRIHSQVRM